MSNKNAAFYYVQVLLVFCREPVLIVTFFLISLRDISTAVYRHLGVIEKKKTSNKNLKELGKIKAHFYYAYLYPQKKRKYFILF